MSFITMNSLKQNFVNQKNYLFYKSNLQIYERKLNFQIILEKSIFNYVSEKPWVLNLCQIKHKISYKTKKSYLDDFSLAIN